MATISPPSESPKALKWKNDPRCEMLKRDNIDGKIPADWKPSQAWNFRDEYRSMDKKIFTSRLKAMRQMIKDGGALEEKEKDPWNKANPVWQLLRKDIVDEEIPFEMDAETAYNLREEYKIMSLHRFKSRLTSMIAMVEAGQARAADDAMDLIHDRLIYPRPAYNDRGEPEWVDHEARELLGIDMDNNLHKRMAPRELYMRRRQYQEFSLETFRGHIYQEEHTRKWKAQWVDGRKEYALVNPPSEN